MVFVLVIANLLVFLGLQLGDRRAEQEAFQWYHEAGLAEIELPRYRDWLAERGRDRLIREHGDRIDDPGSPWLGRMLADGEFLRALRAGEIITEDESGHDRWRRLRSGFEDRLDESATMAWGLRPAAPEAVDWLAHMFLHSGAIHLAGNMVFLVAVGFLVEMALGSLMFLGLYLLAGFGAAGVFVLANPAMAMPLVGASGAVAGLMGLLTVIYGTQRIRFFYFIGVYFDYIKAPALVLLPLWLGHEVYQYLAAPEMSPVAYSAHIGGLVTGAMAATGIRYGTSLVDHEYIVEREREERLQAGLDEARRYVADLQPERARPALRRLRAEFPEDLRVLEAAYETARLEPASDDYHATVRAILELDADDPATVRWILDVYRDYRLRARPRARLSGAAIELTAGRLIADGATGDAAPLVGMMLKRTDRFPHAGEIACRLARACARLGDREAAIRYYSHVARTWPQEEVAGVARRGLARLRA